MTTIAEAGDKTGPGGFTVGHLLRRRREERGAPIEQIAKETRIPTRYLIALEEGISADLPSLTYSVGFVKTYARWLGLAPDMLAIQFKAEAAHHLMPAKVTVLHPLDERKTPSMRLILLSMLGIAAVVIIASLARQGDLTQTLSQIIPGVVSDTPKTPPPAAGSSPVTSAASASAPLTGDTGVAPRGEVLQTDAQPAVAPAAETPPSTAAEPEATIDPAGTVVLSAREDAWVKITDSTTGKTVLQRILRAGDQYSVPAGSRQLLWTGRAGALDISVDGVTLPPLGGPNDVVRDVELTASALAARSTPAQ